MGDNALPELADYRATGREYLSTGLRILFALDSDGNVDNGMRYKHGGPFPRAGVEKFGLQTVSDEWYNVWCFVNEFYDRGCPRFKALAKMPEFMLSKPEIQEKEAQGVVTIPRLTHLRAYLANVADEKGYGDNVLAEYIASLQPGEEKDELELVAAWSVRVNDLVPIHCPYIEPFVPAVEAIKLGHSQGIDQMIVSGTPEAHLRETWRQHGLLDCVLGVYGRDSGKKDVHIVTAARNAAAAGVPYDLIVMFGDAPGDDKKRQAAGETLDGVRVAFVPVRVGYEVEDWNWWSDDFLKPGNVSGYSEATEAKRVEAFYDNLKVEWDPTVDTTRLFTG